MDKRRCLDRGRYLAVDRRRFLKAAGFAGIGLAGLGAGGCAGKSVTPKQKIIPQHSGKTDRVSIQALKKGVSDDAVIQAVGRVAEASTDFSWLSRGDAVFIKTVANSANPYPATTSPLAIRGMVQLLLARGAGRVYVGDKSGVMTVHHEKEDRDGSSREVMRQIGQERAAVDAGADMHYFEEAGYDAYTPFTTTGKGHWKGPLMLPNIVNTVDHIVLLPRVSRHILAGTTLGLKAAVGWLRDDSRLEMHRDADSFFEKIAEINDTAVLREKLRLTLTVATRVLATKGPDEGFVAEPETGLVFASESLLAHDMTALGWLLWNREFETPAGEISWYGDPYTGIPSTLNRGFVGYIWGLREWYHATHYRPVPITSVRTDPVILQASRLWGGLPELEFEEVGDPMPIRIKDYLREKAIV